MIEDRKLPEVIEAQRYVRERKEEIDKTTGEPVRWPKLAKTMGIGSSTLQMFAIGTYTGNYVITASRVHAARERAERAAALKFGRLQEPEFIELPTAQRIMELMEFAHSGHITMVCTAPGTCKSVVAKWYLNNSTKCYLVTLNPLTGRLVPFVGEVLKALGGKVAGSAKWMGEQIVEKLKKQNALLIIDEAGWAETASLEMASYWNELEICGLGVCFLGNSELEMKVASLSGSISGGAHSFSRLNSRIADRITGEIDLSADIDLYLDAWGIDDHKARNLLMDIGTKPSGGGLREVKQTIKTAGELAMLEQQAVNATHINKAQISRGKRALGIAA
jgi:DNA transposition AAA+ family ATPase